MASCDHRSTPTIVSRNGRYRFIINGIEATFQEVMKSLSQSDEGLALSLNDAIRTSSHSAVFWECAPVSSSSASSSPFEFVVLPAPQLSGIVADPSSFAEHLAGEKLGTAKAFLNLGKDAALVVPSPGEGRQGFAHLKDFAVNADRAHVIRFWTLVGSTALLHLKGRETPGTLMWCSTSGLGVPWLHVRLDSRPKYYNFSDYKSGYS